MKNIQQAEEKKVIISKSIKQKIVNNYQGTPDPKNYYVRLNPYGWEKEIFVRIRKKDNVDYKNT